MISFKSINAFPMIFNSQANGIQPVLSSCDMIKCEKVQEVTNCNRFLYDIFVKKLFLNYTRLISNVLPAVVNTNMESFIM